MKIKRLGVMLAAVMLLTGALAVNAFALDYSFSGVKQPEYYRSTNYEEVYGARYNYKGANEVDLGYDPLPYGVSSNTGIGPMEKVRHPGAETVSDEYVYAGYGSGGEFSYIYDYSYEYGYDYSYGYTEYYETAYTSVSGMELSDGSIGTVSIPVLGIAYKVYEGETNSSMAKGLGHYASTSGWDGNVGVCGHNRGARYVIGGIKDLGAGDTITYKTVYGTRTYSVTSVNIIANNDWSYLQATSDNRITLTTCLAGQPEYRVCVQAVEVV